MKKTSIPLISVVVTTHSRPSLLKRALVSILTQSFSEFEIILCSDKTEKKTIEVAGDLLRSKDTFISSPNLRGPAESRNIGIQCARGEWVCFLDDDDTFDANYFSNLSPFLDKSIQIHFANYSRISERRDAPSSPELGDKKSIQITNIPIETLFVYNFIPSNAFVIQSQLAKNYLFDSRLVSHEDWDWLLSLKFAGHLFKGCGNLTGPNVHIDTGEKSRNKADTASLDHLSIYRKWPAENEGIQAERANRLKKLNLSVPSRFL